VSNSWRVAHRLGLPVALPATARCTAAGRRTSIAACARTERAAPDKIRVLDDEIQAVNLHGDPFHPEWNSTIKPQP
jgi:hypothetical protein